MQAASVVQQAVETFGRLDIVINNAGVMLLGPAVDAPTLDWDRMLAVNVQGALYITRAALPHLIKAAESCPRQVADVINVSSKPAGRCTPARPSTTSLNMASAPSVNHSARNWPSGTSASASSNPDRWTPNSIPT